MKDAAPYSIVVAGGLPSDTWARWFEGMIITAAADGTTQLQGEVDQPGLHGVLAKIRDLGLDLISVDRLSGLEAGAHPKTGT